MKNDTMRKRLLSTLLVILLTTNMITMIAFAKVQTQTQTQTQAKAKTTAGTATNLKKFKYTDLVSVVLSPNRESLSVGDTTSISLIGILADGSKVDLTLDNVDYISANESVVTVSRDYGLILLTAISTGDAYIVATLTYEDKSISASYKIKVVKTLNSKTRSTYYTPQRVEIARNNIKKYQWAESMMNSAVKQAKNYLKLNYDQLRNLVTPQSIPRSYAVNQKVGCLNCGKAIDAYGAYPYLIDPINKPFQLECPSCHMKFPTNDFKSYYESGKNSKGIFDIRFANKGFLVNKLYPEKGSKWGVDDGYGFVDANGKRFSFIAYYNHWGLWYRGTIKKALNSFRDAYIYTGDVAYARAGIVLLDRIADVYPAMDISAFKSSYGYLNSTGGGDRGKVVGSIWESEIAKDLLLAYDAFFPVMEDSEVVSYIRQRAEKEGNLKGKQTAIQMERNIEDGIVRQIFPAVKKAQIRGNNGMHQSTLALAAVVLDMLPETRQWLEFVFNAGTASKDKVTGGNILATLVDDVDRDGNGNEASPQYNKLWMSSFMDIADILDGYDLYPAADLFKNVKFKKMFYSMHALILSDQHSALIGDSGTTGGPASYLDKNFYIRAFQEYKDPVLAQVLYFINNNKVDNLKGDIFSVDPDNVANDVQKVINTYGTLKLNSSNSTGYGFAALRDGNGAIDFRLPVENMMKSAGKTQRSVSMYYGRNSGHGHSDALNLDINAFGMDLTPDLGYPEYADESAHRMEWVRNTISHNTVVVDKSRQANQIVGQTRHFEDTELVKLMDIEAPGVYPKTELYRRTTAMIKVDDENSYVVDFFRVRGGKDHYFSFHGAEGDITAEGLKLIRQANARKEAVGSYAGPNVKFGERPLLDSLKGFYYNGGGFHWLDNVSWARFAPVQKDQQDIPDGKDDGLSAVPDQKTEDMEVARTTSIAGYTPITLTTPSAFRVDWQIKDTWNVLGKGRSANTNVHLKMTMLELCDDVAVCDGKPPRNNSKNPRNLKYVIAHRTGKNLDSTFNSVIEPYKGKPFIKLVTPAAITVNGAEADPTRARAIKVVLENGRTDYIISTIDANTTFRVDGKFNFRGSFGLYCEKNGKPYKIYINDAVILGDVLMDRYARISGTIEDHTKGLDSTNVIKVSLDEKDCKPETLKGRYIYVNSGKNKDAVYLIKDARPTGNSMILDIGDISLINSFKNVNDFSKGYNYDVTAGDRFVIPLSKTWSAAMQ